MLCNASLHDMTMILKKKRRKKKKNFRSGLSVSNSKRKSDLRWQIHHHILLKSMWGTTWGPLVVLHPLSKPGGKPAQNMACFLSSAASPSPAPPLIFPQNNSLSSSWWGMKKSLYFVLPTLWSHRDFLQHTHFSSVVSLPWWKRVTFGLSEEHLGRYNLYFTACACTQGL